MRKWLVALGHRAGGMDLPRLRWCTVLVPPLCVGLYETVRHSLLAGLLPNLMGNLVATGVVLLASYGFAHVVFGLIERTQAELVRRHDDLAALNQLAMALNSSLDLSAVLSAALDATMPRFAAHAGAVVLLDERGGAVEGAQRGSAQAWPAEVAQQALARPGPALAALADGSPAAVVVLASKGRALGLLWLASRDRAAFAAERLALLAAMADTIGLAVDNAQLHGRVQSAAIIEERERLAREMHDGLAQVLVYTGVKIDTIKALVASGRLAEADAELERLRQASGEAYTSVREAILGLTTRAGAGRDLLSALREFAERFSDDSGLAVEVSASGPLPALTPTAEIQLVRIVQEALTNVRRHAGARRARVAFSRGQDGGLRLAIADDGCGFDPAAPRPGGHFGLHIMRERAASLGGNLSIHSEPGRGTVVQLELPPTGRFAPAPAGERAGGDGMRAAV